MRRHRRQRRGYVLVMVLGLLVLSATLLIAVSRAAARSAIAARAAEEDLQRRWGVASCRRAVLPYADIVLTRLEAERKRPVPSAAFAIKLGTDQFELIVADEQAKANVNTLLEGADVTRTESRIRQGLAGSGLVNRVKLRPTVGPAIVAMATDRPTTQPVIESNAPHVESWGQVFDEVPATQLIRATGGSRAAAAEILTCWGSGAVNIYRASEAAINLAAGRTLSGAEVIRLVEARDKLYGARPKLNADPKTPAEQLKEIVDNAISQSAKNKGNLALVQGSKCHSLWIISRNGRRDGYDLFVLDKSNDTKPLLLGYSW